MMRKRTTRQGILTIAPLFAAVLLFAGCGGSGGGGGAAVQKFGSMRAVIELPPEPAGGPGRVAASCSADYSYTATVSVESFSSAGSGTSVASTSNIPITCNSSTNKYQGNFEVTGIPVGSNYIVHVTKYSTTSATATAHAGAIVDTISDGVTTEVTVTATSTVTALATLRYALTRSTPVAMSAVSSSAKTAIAEAVTDYAAATSSVAFSSVVYQQTEIFNPSNWSSITVYNSTYTSSTTLAAVLDAILALADFAPKASKFYIDSTQISPSATSTASVDTEAPVFKIVFTEGMDTSVNLNATSTLSNIAPVINLSSSGGGTLTINSSNALDYGTFAWATTTVAGDTLTYTLIDTITLAANSLKYLKPNYTYTISSWTLTGSSYLKSAGGVPFSTTGISTTGSFTTVDTTAPTAYKFYISGTEISTSASSATGVPYDSPYFKIVFSESMDTALMDTDAEIASSGVSITLVRSDTGGTLTINGSNVISYGEDTWETTNFASDTMKLTLFSNATLSANGLQTLQSGKTYNITSWTVASTLKDLAGNAISTTGVAATGTFTTQ